MAKGLLAGITVLDFTAAFVGPFCSRIMADMGARKRCDLRAPGGYVGLNLRHVGRCAPAAGKQ